jgi:hypothetical protein
LKIIKFATEIFPQKIAPKIMAGFLSLDQDSKRIKELGEKPPLNRPLFSGSLIQETSIPQIFSKPLKFCQKKTLTATSGHEKVSFIM